MTFFTDKETAQKRYNLCKSCEQFNKITTQCKICNCFMKIKVKIADVDCPLNKWQKTDVLYYNKEEGN